jgi:hypothetical protein
MDKATEFQTLASAFSLAWKKNVAEEGEPEDLQPITPIAWPNVDYAPTVGVPWVRFNVIPGESGRAALGKDFVRHVGVIMIQIFTPLGSGEMTARDLADEVTDIYRGAMLSGFRFGEPSISRTGPDGEGWFMATATIPYQRDEVVT